ncbi:MAG: hypothetical protein ACLU0O_08730 [Collinsella sp.]
MAVRCQKAPPRSGALAYFKHGIELAEVLGARICHQLRLGRLGRDREEAWKRSAEHLAILADYAGELA